MDIFYYLMFAFFVTHEIDAAYRHEWRVLPLTSFLPEDTGRNVFIWAHVPLFWAIFHFGGTDPESTLAFGLSTFSIIHVGLHWLFRNHPRNEFNNPVSWALILGAGTFGLLHIVGGWV